MDNAEKIEPELARTRFRRLMAANPNYFGTAPGLGLEVVLPKQGDTTYERLSRVVYSPERDRLEATVELRRPTGYSGGLCTIGSFEHVRFHVSYDGGTSWSDAGVASVNVHDLAPEEECRSPLSYVVGLDHRPRRNRRTRPAVRAILSWEVVPPAGRPDWKPIWGDVRSVSGKGPVTTNGSPRFIEAATGNRPHGNMSGGHNGRDGAGRAN